ncbi:MAG: serine/threonine protein kinase [Planctomycetaceae bacterium]|nr:serine/threonine protein kinase [Planctomycetaceae bacterium]
MSNFAETSSESASRPRRSSEPAPSKLLGNWQLERIVSAGPFTNVYFARPLGCPPSWPADYVVKVLNTKHAADPVAVNALRREAEVGRHSSHPNLVPILEARLDERLPHLVMPRLVGAPLSAAIRGVGRLAVPQALWISRQVAQALRHLHAKGWVHADVKPANIMVSKDGHATLIDLGSSLRPDESIFAWQRPVVGTLKYVAPELLTSATQTNPSSDIYSLGISLFEMLVGHPPFVANEPEALVEAHLSCAAPDVGELRADVPDSVGYLLRGMLAKTPLRRPQSADEVINQIASLEIESLESRFDSVSPTALPAPNLVRCRSHSVSSTELS